MKTSLLLFKRRFRASYASEPGAGRALDLRGAILCDGSVKALFEDNFDGEELEKRMVGDAR